jgi:hypothetical protein
MKKLEWPEWVKKLELPEWLEAFKEAALKVVEDFGGWKALASIVGAVCLGATILGMLVCFVLAFFYVLPVWIIWNLTVPGVFGLAKLSFWQAYGIVLLSMFLIRGPNFDGVPVQDKGKENAPPRGRPAWDRCTGRMENVNLSPRLAGRRTGRDDD